MEAQRYTSSQPPRPAGESPFTSPDTAPNSPSPAHPPPRRPSPRHVPQPPPAARQRHHPEHLARSVQCRQPRKLPLRLFAAKPDRFVLTDHEAGDRGQSLGKHAERRTGPSNSALSGTPSLSPPGIGNISPTYGFAQHRRKRSSVSGAGV